MHAACFICDVIIKMSICRTVVIKRNGDTIIGSKCVNFTFTVLMHISNEMVLGTLHNVWLVEVIFVYDTLETLIYFF